MNPNEMLKAENELKDYLTKNGIKNVRVNEGVITIANQEDENDVVDGLRNNLDANLEIIKDYI
jgi:hypothetical protein